MAQPSLKAEFFARPDGICIPKAPPLSYREKNVIKDRDRNVCQLCGARILRLGRDVSPFMEYGKHGQIDHIFPRSRGGQNDPANLRLLCVTCNARKGAK